MLNNFFILSKVIETGRIWRIFSSCIINIVLNFLEDTKISLIINKTNIAYMAVIIINDNNTAE